MDHLKLNVYNILIKISEFIDKNIDESNSPEYIRALEDIQKIIINKSEENL